MDIMFLSFTILLYQMFGTGPVGAGTPPEEIVLFNFTQNGNLADWVESSDTTRDVGMSKAALIIQKTKVFQRAIFFTLLNPQPNGAAFAGMNYRGAEPINLSNYSSITMSVRGQGQNDGYKVVLRHKNLNQEPHPTYEQLFTAPMNSFDTVTLPLEKFQAYYRGRPVPDASPLDKSFISSFGIQMYGGVYLPKKQFGASTLEIDWIKATL